MGKMGREGVTPLPLKPAAMGASALSLTVAARALLLGASIHKRYFSRLSNLSYLFNLSSMSNLSIVSNLSIMRPAATDASALSLTVAARALLLGASIHKWYFSRLSNLSYLSFFSFIFFGVPHSASFIFVIFLYVIASIAYIPPVYGAGVQTHDLLILSHLP